MDLDLFLAAHMGLNADLRRRLERAGVSPRDLDCAKNRPLARKVMQRNAAFDSFAEAFGPPVQVHGDRSYHRLSLWPDHRFEVRDLDGLLALNGFRLKTYVDGEILSSGSPLGRRIHSAEPNGSSAEESEGVFVVGYHTAPEIERVLGRPKRISGWERMEDWEYDRGTVFSFEFDLLSAIKGGAHPR